MIHTNIHHIIPTSRGGEIHRGANTIRLDMNFHKALHVLYGNASPLQQVLMVMNFDKGFRGRKASEIYNLIRFDQLCNHYCAYQPGVIINPALIGGEVKSNSGKARSILDAHRYVHYSESAHVEAKIYTLLAIADTALTDDFKKRVTNILA